MSTIRVRTEIERDTVAVQCLIQHPMDSGFIKDAAGNLIPAHYIETVTFTSNGRTVFTAFWGPAVSKDPFLGFSYEGGRTGDTLAISWTDSKGQSGTTTHVL